MTYYDYKYRPQPSFPDIIDEIFAPLVASIETKPKTDIGKQAPDGSIYTLAVEIPRLVRDTITVSVEPISTQHKTMAHKVVVKAGQKLLENYLDANAECAKKSYQQEFIVLGQQVALDSSLNLYYSEGVLVVEIPLTKPVQPKKAILSARLSDMEA
jgi:hypothetical protein